MLNDSRAATFLLLLGVFFWGATFAFIKDAVSHIAPCAFVAVRFLIAAAVLGALTLLRDKRLQRKSVRLGMIAGAFLAASYIFQTISLKYTTAANSAFLTGLCVAIVPVLGALADRRAPSPIQSFAAVLALGGLTVMSYAPGIRMNRGDLWALACAFTFAVQIFLIGRAPRDVEAGSLATVQMTVVAAAAFLCSSALEGSPAWPFHPGVWRAALFCALFGSAYMYAAQARLQKSISAVRAVMIYSLEPLFAALIARFALDEPLTPRTLAGGAMILAAMTIADLKFPQSARLKIG